MYHGVKNVQPTDDYNLILLFDNDEKRVFDSKPLLEFGRFSELSNMELFKKVHIAFDTIE